MVLSAALFIIGVVGVMVRRNIIIIFMSIELILNAVNINLVAYSNQMHHVVGQVFAIFVIAVAAAEAAVGLGIILAFYRKHRRNELYALVGRRGEMAGAARAPSATGKKVPWN